MTLSSHSKPPGGAKWQTVWLLWVPVVVFLAIVGFQMLGPTPIGLADNGDFPRTLGPLRLWPVSGVPPASVQSSHFRFFLPEYVISEPKYDPGVPSTEWLIARLAKNIARLVLPRDRFDLRVMGVVHALMMALALICFLRALRDRKLWIRLLFAVAVLWIWTDVEYVQQFSTAYTDAGAIAALCITFSVALIVLLTRGGNSVKWAIGFAAAAFLFVGTKLQHVPAFIPIAAFALLMAFYRARSRTARAVWLATPVVLLGTVWFMVSKTPDDYRTAPAFTVVFYKLAVLSKEPNRVLAAFGMPKKFSTYIGHYYYEPNMPADEPFRRRIRAMVTPSSLALFYLHNPDVLAKVIRYDWRISASDVNLKLYGDLREIDVIHHKTSPEFNLWSGVRQRLFRIAPIYPVVFFVFSLLLCLAGACRKSVRASFPLWPLPAVVTIIAGTGFLTGSLLDAVETARHLVLFQVATDLTILSVFLALAVRNQTRETRSLISRAAE